MTKQASKVITEIQRCYKLKQDTARGKVWMGHTIILMSFFDKYLNSFLNEEKNPALRQSLGRAFEAEERANSKP